MIEPPQSVSHRIGHGITCGKFILMGEHSVVYGEPAIAIPLLGVSMRASVSRTTGTAWFKSDIYDGPLDAMPERVAGLKGALEASVAELGITTRDLSITIESDVPAERGMGSSAASAGALIRALFDLEQVELDRNRLFELVQVAERIAHGKPSGLDAVATSAHAPVAFHQGNFADLDINLSGAVVIGDTGIKGGTRETVSALRQRYEQEPASVTPDIQQLGELTRAARGCLENNELDRLGDIFNQAHRHLDRLGVSSPELNQLVTTALEAGALGAKMTGGGAGGCMLALCSDLAAAEQVVQSLVQQGAARCWVHTFDQHLGKPSSNE